MQYFVGILHTNSIVSYTTNKSDTIKKDFTSFVSLQNKILVKTKRLTQCPDTYIVAKFESIDVKTGVITCIVHEYLDNVNIIKFLKALSTSHWTRKHDKLFNEIVHTDLTPNRTMIDTNIEIYSIDPDGCMDIDDALHCVKTTNGWQVGIHIADVSSYIEEGSTCDIELSKRVETFYSDYPQFPNQNMIPNIISLEIASLRDTKISRSFSVIVDYDDSCVVIDVKFQKSLIKVTKNLSYDLAQQIINNNESQSLVNLYELGKKLKKCDKKYDTHSMVEVFMIQANELVAKYITQKFPENVILRSQPMSKSIKSDNCTNTENFLNEIYLKSLNEKAMYVVGYGQNCYHHSLNLEYYTHFTSPIRRYVDILVHRLLYRAINEINYSDRHDETIEFINVYSKYYKKLQRYTHLLSVLDKLDEITEIEAYIVCLNSEHNSLRVYIADLDIEIDIKVINKKFAHIIQNLSQNENVLSITNTQTNQCANLALFDKILIQIVKIDNLCNPINTAILNPPLQLILGVSFY